MEQQSVTIAKAGIHASLNARCSVLAAANPVYGQYDKTKRPQENIGLPDSLLSRFDLLFIVLDQLDPTLDRRISEHVIKSHQYRKPGTIMEPEPLNQSSSLNLDDDGDMAVDTPMYQRGGRTFSDANSNVSKDILTKEFLRKYIYYAKNRISPVLSDEAIEVISEEYSQMRSRQTKKNLPITARTLETIIRISTASAKARLSTSIDTYDVEMAIDLMNFVLFHDINEMQKMVPVEKDSTTKENSRTANIDLYQTVFDFVASETKLQKTSIALQDLKTIVPDASQEELDAVIDRLGNENKVSSSFKYCVDDNNVPFLH